MNERIQQLPPLFFRAGLSSINEERRTCDLVWSSGAGVERRDWVTGERYIEKLSLKDGDCDLSRLNAGAPLLDSHHASSVNDVIGSVIPGSAKIQSGKGIATVKFSTREVAAAIWADVKSQIVRGVSVGYRVLKYVEDVGKSGELPTRTAVSWLPYELSLVSMPADIGAHVRGEQRELNQCVIVTRGCLYEGLRTDDADRLRRFRLAQLQAVTHGRP